MSDSLYWIDFSAEKVMQDAGDYWSGKLQQHAVAVMAKTQPRMKKRWFFFDDGMETWEEAFDRTWNCHFEDRFGLYPGWYHIAIAEELYYQAKKLTPTEIMRLDDAASKIVTFFD